jgi:hypothetical protein
VAIASAFPLGRQTGSRAELIIFIAPLQPTKGGSGG